jgi:hypothetical protein
MFRVFESHGKLNLLFMHVPLTRTNPGCTFEPGGFMDPISAPADMPTLLELIRTFMRENYQTLEPAELQKEAERLVDQLRKEAAGRVCWQWDEWKAAYEHIGAYIEKQEFEVVFSAPRPILRGRKASERIPFL